MNELENILRPIEESEAVIKNSENFIGMGFWNIGNELKYIRDNKTYTDKNYKSFEEYVEKELDYSRQHSYKFITIAESYSVASMRQIGGLGITKLLELKKIEESEREKFIEDNPVNEMTTKELQKAIKERDEALKTLETAKKIANDKSEEAKKNYDEKCSAESKARTVDAVLREAQKDVKNLQDALRKQKEKSEKDIADLQSFIGEAESTGDNEEVLRLQASLQELQNDVDSSALKIDELEAQLKEKPVDITETIVEKIPEEVEKELQELRKKANQSSDQAVIKFKIYFEELQVTFKSELEVMDGIKERDPETYEKCKRNVLNLINSMAERL